MPALTYHPESPTPLLTLDEHVLLRTWIRGIPLAALDRPLDNRVFAQLAECRMRLHLKAIRLQRPDAALWLKRIPDAQWERKALASLDHLQTRQDIAPALTHPLAYWLDPAWVSALNSIGLVTLAGLLEFRQQQGLGWWQAVPGLGRVSAKRVEQHLKVLWPDTTLSTKPPPLPVFSTGMVPLERFLLPEPLDGRHGRNRAESKPFIPLDNDLAAIQAWLSLRDPASHTFRSYQREAERLLLWSILARQKAFADLDAVDLAEYRSFIIDPQPAATWIGPPHAKNHPQWKPFTGPLALRSVKHAETILTGLFNFLVQQRYLAHNPLSALPRLKHPGDQLVLGVHRAFSPAHWALITSVAEQRIQHSSGQLRRKAIRTQMILQLAYATGLRLQELTQATLGDNVTLSRQTLHRQASADESLLTTTQHWLKVIGKGQKLRQVPLPPATLQLLQNGYHQLTGHAMHRQPPGYPLFPSLHNPKQAVTPLAIHKVLKAFFADVAEHARRTQPDAVTPLLQASTHWLRHTHGSAAIEQGIPLAMIRDNLGHASIATTSHYLHTEADARYEAFKHITDSHPVKPS